MTLEFTAGGRRLRIERSPEFLRPKSRGGGETKVQARAVLWERRGADVGRPEHPPRRDRRRRQGRARHGPRAVQQGRPAPPGRLRRVPAGHPRGAPVAARAALRRVRLRRHRGLVRRRSARTPAAVVADQRAALNADLAVLADVLADAPTSRADRATGPTCRSPSSRLPSTTARRVPRRGVDRQAGRGRRHPAGRRRRDHRTRHRSRDGGAPARAAWPPVPPWPRSTPSRTTRDAAAARIELAERAASVAGDLKALDRVAASLQAARAPRRRHASRTWPGGRWTGAVRPRRPGRRRAPRDAGARCPRPPLRDSRTVHDRREAARSRLGIDLATSTSRASSGHRASWRRPGA